MPALMRRFPTQISPLRSLSIFSGIMASSTTDQSAPPPMRKYTPKNPEAGFPYSAKDMTPMDRGDDASFYTMPRFVTHIDDNAINNLRKYYDKVLPKKGRILDFCSSWISHYPPEIEKAAHNGELEVVGLGMNKSELSHNPVLKAWAIQDLNEDPDVRIPGTEIDSEAKLDASTCVVSIDYLTDPVQVLSGIRQNSNDGAKVHLVISNRCFPTKVVGRWLKISEVERLEMVGDYLWWSGWRDIEIVTVVEGTWMKDPLWVVRASKIAG